MRKLIAACVIAVSMLAGPGPKAQTTEIVMQVSPVTYQGNSAQVSVDLRNVAGRRFTGLVVTCQFIAAGAAVATTQRTVPLLGPGDTLTIEVLQDVAGQPIDAVRCGTETYGR